MRKQRRMAAAALVLALALVAGGCAGRVINLRNPTNVIGTTRVGIAQTADVIAVGLDAGMISSKDGRDMQQKLGQAAVLLVVAEVAILQGEPYSAQLNQAVATLDSVRGDPRLIAPVPVAERVLQ